MRHRKRRHERQFASGTIRPRLVNGAPFAYCTRGRPIAGIPRRTRIRGGAAAGSYRRPGAPGSECGGAVKTVRWKNSRFAARVRGAMRAATLAAMVSAGALRPPPTRRRAPGSTRATFSFAPTSNCSRLRLHRRHAQHLAGAVEPDLAQDRPIHRRGLSGPCARGAAPRLHRTRLPDRGEQAAHPGRRHRYQRARAGQGFRHSARQEVDTQVSFDYLWNGGRGAAQRRL